MCFLYMCLRVKANEFTSNRKATKRMSGKYCSVFLLFHLSLLSFFLTIPRTLSSFLLFVPKLLNKHLVLTNHYYIYILEGMIIG